CRDGAQRGTAFCPGNAPPGVASKARAAGTPAGDRADACAGLERITGASPPPARLRRAVADADGDHAGPTLHGRAHPGTAIAEHGGNRRAYTEALPVLPHFRSEPRNR